MSWPQDRKFANGVRVVHRPTGKTAFIDGVMSNRPRQYCIYIGDGTDIGMYWDEGDLEASPTVEWPAAYDPTGEREPPGEPIDEYQMTNPSDY